MGRQRGFVSMAALMCAERGCNGLCRLTRLFVSNADYLRALSSVPGRNRSGFHRCFSSTVALNPLSGSE
ncbi:hypothetical protein I7I48_02338 [Histoplasma ohiense]|nr:hypothetical protein I7I48_02338 [Histoplasma ohiense (nom. inval.)]